MAPLLLVALLAVCLLLFLAIRRVETVVLREGRLSLSLHQEKQRRSQKSDFVSMVSHELRTPLQAIGTAADLLERFGDQMSEPERREERSEEHTSELQSLMRISYAVFCLKKKKKQHTERHTFNNRIQQD